MSLRFLAAPRLGGVQLPSHLVQLLVREESLDLREHLILFFIDVMLDVLTQNLELGVESFASRFSCPDRTPGPQGALEA